MLSACLGFRASGFSRLGVSGFRVSGLGSWVPGLGFRVQGLGFRVEGAGPRVFFGFPGLGRLELRVLGLQTELALGGV